jgi:hypothetical protein
MKETDQTSPIMQKVITFEKRRIRRWGWIVLFTISTLIILFAACITMLTQSFFDVEVKDILSLYISDREMLKEIWKEVLSFIWDVIPHAVVFIAFGIMLFALGLFICTRHKQRIIGKRLKEIKSYTQK